MNIYLDNAATTRTLDEVVAKICSLLQEKYGNPSSLHYKGIEAEKEVTGAREILAKILKVEKKEIYFTSGGTESNNLALIGMAKAYVRSGKHIIVASIEHPSVSATIKYLEEEGFEITTLPVNEGGLIDLGILEQAIRPDTIIVTVMHINNEIGTIQPIETIGQIIKRINPNTLFHVDAVQSFGKLPIFPKRWYIDSLSISGHKIYAPKGIGALYINSKTKIKPIIFGGQQQQGIRSGTENTSGIAALGVAGEYMYRNLEKNTYRMHTLKERLKNGILKRIDAVYVNGFDNERSASHILNMRFDDIRGEVLLHALESKNIYISTGSACSSNKPEPSATLKAIGLTDKQIENSVRFSFSIYNTEEEIDYCIKQLDEIVPKLRKFIRK